MKIGLMGILILTALGIAVGLAIAGLPLYYMAVILAGAVVFYLAFFRPILTVALLLGVVPFNILWVGLGITPQEIAYSVLYAALLVSWLIRKAGRLVAGERSRAPVSPITWPLIVFLGFFVFSAIIGLVRGHPFKEWGSDLNAISYYSLCFIIIDTVKDKKIIYRLFTFMLVMMVLGLVKEISIVGKNLAFYGITTMQTGMLRLRNVNITALPALFICAAFAMKADKTLKKIFFAAVFILLFAMQIVSFARALWLSMIAGIAFLALVTVSKNIQKSNLIKFTAAMILVLSVFLAIAAALPSDNVISRWLCEIEQRYWSISTFMYEPSVITRGYEWKAAVAKALAHPVLGNGLGAQVTYFRIDEWYGTQRWESTRYIHNSYLSIFLTMGLFGLVSFLWFCLSFMKYGLSLVRSLKDETDRAFALGVTSGFFALMIASFAGPLFTAPMLTIWLGFFMGALVLIDRSRDKTA